jgi:hypothetical protein
MNPANDVSWRGVASALVRSYVADLRAWAAKLAAGYGVAVAMLVGGVLTLFAAIAVGVTALFQSRVTMEGTPPMALLEAVCSSLRLFWFWLDGRCCGDGRRHYRGPNVR